MSRLILSLALLFIGCGPRHTTQSKPETIYSVSCTALTRDYPSASAYQGQKIRIHLGKDDYQVINGEIHVWADRDTVPPVLILRGAVFPSKESVTVVGKVTSVIRDGKWRSPRCDFYIIIEECMVTAR